MMENTKQNFFKKNKDTDNQNFDKNVSTSYRNRKDKDKTISDNYKFMLTISIPIFCSSG